MNRFCSYLWVFEQDTLIKQEVLLINLKQQILWQFALQFSDEFVGNGSKAC
ncbi:hypothetical protein BSPWISOXPB_10665 [uncultured Gammaproteobacteria bacterium]|nr:hypothetical protein BSPWISOXPB_10665 [uncultured Gammaproteobacteria bacterium]